VSQRVISGRTKRDRPCLVSLSAGLERRPPSPLSLNMDRQVLNKSFAGHNCDLLGCARPDSSTWDFGPGNCCQQTSSNQPRRRSSRVRRERNASRPPIL
jgi:hypothetical protein